MNDDAGEVVCIYQFRVGPGKHSPRLSYEILVDKEWVHWRSWKFPALLDDAVIHTDRNGGRYATPALVGVVDA